jgi:transcriptional regulator with XRE-family HTH domain
MEPIYRHLGAAIRDARRGRTSTDIAGRLGVAPHTVQAWANGTRRIPVHRLVDVAEALGVGPCDLLGDAIDREGQ